MSMSTDDPFERAVEREKATRRWRKGRRARYGFRVHLRVFVIVQVILFTSWAIEWVLDPGHPPWFLSPLIAWAAGVLVHYVMVRPAFRGRPPADNASGVASGV